MARPTPAEAPVITATLPFSNLSLRELPFSASSLDELPSRRLPFAMLTPSAEHAAARAPVTMQGASHRRRRCPDTVMTP
jgi:hypothetical protein